MGHTKIKYVGNPPPNGKLVFQFSGWELFELATRLGGEGDDGGYTNYKLVSTIKREKANYWFGWNWKTRTMVSHRDPRMLKENFPKVYNVVIEFIEKGETK